MDGVRTAEGSEGVTGAMIRARIWVDGRLAGGLQALLGAPMAVYRRFWGHRWRSTGAFGGTDGGLQWLWRARWRDRTRQEALADWAGASLRGRWVGWWVSGGRAPSGWEWNGSQSGQGAAELLLPRASAGEDAGSIGVPSG